jgi:acyl-CoA thioester hydrolase
MKIEIPHQKKLTHEILLPIRWSDMDAMSHVNNAVYFTYMETIRIDWLHSLGGAPDPKGTGPVIANAFCNFYKQLEYPGTILARHYVGGVGRSSFDTFITLERTDNPGTIYAAGGATTVWVDFPKQKSTPLPEWLRKVLE